MTSSGRTYWIAPPPPGLNPSPSPSSPGPDPTFNPAMATDILCPLPDSNPTGHAGPSLPPPPREVEVEAKEEAEVAEGGGTSSQLSGKSLRSVVTEPEPEPEPEPEGVVGVAGRLFAFLPFFKCVRRRELVGEGVADRCTSRGE